MKIQIKRLNIDDNPTNEVTSHKIFRDKKIKDANGNFLYNDKGIFSKKIFGQYGHCDCSTDPKKSAGICPKCNVRVLSKKETPDYYISFPEIDIPYIDIDYGVYAPKKKIIKALMNYEGFIYDGKYIKNDIESENMVDYMFNKEDILIGKEAVMSLGVDEDWYNSNITNKVYIPHPSFRKITTVGDKHFIGTLNKTLVDVIKKKNTLSKYLSLTDNNKLGELLIKHEMIMLINSIYNELFNLLAKHNKSVIKREVRGQNLTGAIRSVITNNFSLDEDHVIIGKYFIKTLYPELYEKYVEFELDKDGNKIYTGKINIEGLNKELVDGAYHVLINRPPTIGEKSIMAFNPVFSDLDEEKYVIQLNPISMDGFAGDFDGDVLLVIALYTTEANKEAEQLLPSKNYIGGANDCVRNQLPEDFVYVMQTAYEKDKEAAEEISNIINGGNV